MEAVKTYTDDQLSRAKKLINILMGAPNNKRAMVAAVTTAYMDGVEAGVLIAEGHRVNCQGKAWEGINQ